MGSQVSDLHLRSLELRALELDFLQLGVLAVESGDGAMRGRQPRRNVVALQGIVYVFRCLNTLTGTLHADG